MGTGRPAAYFDLDGTLLAVNSGALWLRREIRHRRVTPRQVLHGLGFLLAYRFGVVDIERATRAALATVKGVREDDVRAWTREWFDAEVTPRAAPGAAAALRFHRAEGHPCWLLSSTSPYEAACAVEFFGLDGWLATRYEVADGRFTGEPVLPICFGHGKIRCAEEQAARDGIDLDASFFYSDSHTDLPMLERVGHPRVVNPDPRLAWTARRRGWPVLDWQRP